MLCADRVSDDEAMPSPPWVDDDSPPHGNLRVPPHSNEAEQSVLGALLQEPSAFAGVADVVAQADFYSHAHRLIYGAICDLAAAGSSIDVVTVFTTLDRNAADAGGLPYLNALAQSVPSAAHVLRHAEIVAERASLRAIISAGDDLVARAFAGAADPAAVIEAAKSAFGSIEMRRKMPRRGVPLLALEALQEAAQSVRWLVKHVIPADSIGMMFGGSGTFKSFIALDAALHVAHGLPWLGRKTAGGQVLYIAAEGGSGLWSRIHAWHRVRHLRWQGARLHVVPAAIDLTADAWRVVEAAQAAGVSPSMVVVDTLSQTYSGEENSANEMAAYLREIGLRFRQLWQCAVLLIHHSGHQATERPRGSSAIRANLDFMFGVFRDEKEMLATVTSEKQKDGELFQDATFALSPHELGRDGDGDPITSLVARHLSSAEEVQQAAEEEGRAGRAGKGQLLLRLAQNGMRESDLRKAFYEDCGLDDQDSKKRTYNRSKAAAVKRGFLDFAEGYVITLKGRA